MHGEDNGQAAEYEDEDANEDESVDRDDVVVGKAVPRTYSTVPGEDGYSEEHVDSGLEGVIFCFKAEPIAFELSAQLDLLKVVKGHSLPGEDVAGDKARKDIVAAEHAECADDEKLQRIVSMSFAMNKN